MTRYGTVRVTFSTKRGGKMICVPSGYTPRDPYSGSVWTFPLKNEGPVMVQVYSTDESEGMIMGDVVQDGRTITIDFGRSVTGWPVLVKPAKVMEFTDATDWTFHHNLNRWVCAQVYIEDEGQALADVHNLDENTVQVEFNQPMSGCLLVV